MNSKKYEIYPLGEDCLVLKLLEEISNQTSEKIAQLFNLFKREFPFAYNIVPSYREIGLYFNPLSHSSSKIKEQMKKIFLKEKTNKTFITSKRFIIQTSYNGDDLASLCNYHSMTKEGLIQLHSRQIYTIACIGFIPYFPYLIGLDSQLHTPRKDTPRLDVPAGSVAIGGQQTGIYPEKSPGAWHIIGTISQLSILEELNIGDTIKFSPI